MANTSHISPEPRIKHFAGSPSVLSYDTIKTTLGNFTNLIDDEWLRTGESAYCICTHHVEKHCTIRDQYDRIITIYCHSRPGNYEDCNCVHFRPRSMKVSCLNSATDGVI